jgi:KaiC/GvpD/RAD55 family RecA-like ATPase
MAGNPDTKIYIPTGSDTLNRLLAMDAPKKEGGILVKDDAIDFRPIVLIEGSAGTGKTTLALQIAHAVADPDPKPAGEPPARKRPYRPFFYSLEQSIESLKSAAKNYGFDPGASGDLFWDFQDEEKPVFSEARGGKIYLCHLSKLPISQREQADVFEERFNLLQHMVTRMKGEADKAKDEPEKRWTPVFFVDSLNALTTAPLGRHEIYRLFQLFRAHEVPAVLTAERYDSADPARNASSEAARFLADIAISLTKDASKDHLQMYLEISKSRVGRQAFGRHLYKIRSEEHAKRIETEEPGARGGIVVYPSIHSVLSRARDNQPAAKDQPEGGGDYQITIDPSNEKDISLIIQNTQVKTGACFAVVGPTGTHKLALAMNLATGKLITKSKLSDDDALKLGKLLIVKFGGAGVVDFQGVAWFAERKDDWLDLKPPTGSQDNQELRTKWWTVEYRKRKLEIQGGKETWTVVTGPSADVLTFQLGELTPEECFYVIEKKVFDDDKKTPKYSAVLLSDTAALCTGFPALRADPVFLPSLIDLFKTNRIVSVCIGVEGGADFTREIDLGLSARADYRISLSHCPDMPHLMQHVFESQVQAETPEQSISLVIDNVMGQNYSRTAKWLKVSTDKQAGNKVLYCKEIRELDKSRNSVTS